MKLRGLSSGQVKIHPVQISSLEVRGSYHKRSPPKLLILFTTVFHQCVYK